MYITSDMRERSLFFDQTVEALQADLARPQLASALGEFGVFAAAQLERAYLPNRRHGTVILPEHFHTNRLPIVAVRSDERLIISGPRGRMTTRQEANARDELRLLVGESVGRLVLERVTDRLVADGDKPAYFTLNPKNMAEARGISTPWQLPDGTRHTFFAKPVVALRMHMPPDVRLTPAGALLHELSHVDDREQCPVLATGEQSLLAIRRRGELKACHRGALHEDATETWGKQTDVDRCREGLLEKSALLAPLNNDQEVPYDALLEALAENNLTLIA